MHTLPRFGKQGAGGGVFQIKIGVPRKHLAAQRGFAHLACAQNQHGGKLAGQVAQAFGTQAGVRQ
jgi:hypothetical protein